MYSKDTKQNQIGKQKKRLTMWLYMPKERLRRWYRPCPLVADCAKVMLGG